MANDSIKCPLCGGLAPISRSGLLDKLKDPDLLAKVQAFVAQLQTAAVGDQEAVGVGADFQTQVHSWNPANPMWKRSPKE